MIVMLFGKGVYYSYIYHTNIKYIVFYYYYILLSYLLDLDGYDTRQLIDNYIRRQTRCNYIYPIILYLHSIIGEEHKNNIISVNS